MKNWNHFKKHYFDTLTGVTIDYSKIKFKKNFFPEMNKRMGKALKAMKEIEAGSFANVDENRQVGHYWLRDSSLAPTQKITKEIQASIRLIKKISKNISEGSLKGVKGKFENLLIIGIGGSALGSQFLTNALISHKKNDINVLFLDNTDPDGIELTLSNIKTQLGKTLVIVISKSGGTPETRNAMILTQHAYKQKRINFNEHAISITEKGSQLYKLSKTQKWIDTLPMWDWVGGRTSIFSAVGLLPAAIQGIDIGNLLKGAKIMDSITRDINIQKNPAAILALSWYQATGGKGKKDMVILPYKDQLMLFSKYLQQLIMESLGKGINLDGVKVSQGISVYGNKGSTDQHAYIQQLRDGINNFFVNFIEVNKQNEYSKSPFVDEHQNKAGDYLNGFFLGTQQALLEKGRESISISIDEINPNIIGQIIALFERAVGLYAHLININAYHQPGVEAGKLAAKHVLILKNKILELLSAEQPKCFSIKGLAKKLDLNDKEEIIFKICTHLSYNNPNVKMVDRSSNLEKVRFYFIK